MTAFLLAASLVSAPRPDPFIAQARQVATKALRGDFGKLAPWQAKGYEAILRGPTRTMMAWRTHYGPYEGRQGRVDAYGQPCTKRTLAANRLRRRAWVLLMAPHWELRQVLDCGGRGNDAAFADANGCSVWVDRWHRSPALRNAGGRVRIAVAAQ